MKIGYSRISTSDQNLDLQTDALDKEGCNQIFSDTASGAKTDRPGLEEALSYLRKGDTLVVWKLDRLGRSLKHLIEVVIQLNERGIYFKSIQESIDTSTSGGKLIFHVFGALAEFERGIGYVNDCQKMLKEAEQRIEILTKESKGNLSD